MKIARTVIIALIVSLGLAAMWVGAQDQFQIVSPPSGTTVHGLVTLGASQAAVPDGGWVSFRIRPGPDEYLTATTSPFQIHWNSQVRDEDDKRLYPDGSYTVEAVVYDGSGKEQARDTIRVQVANDISSREIGTPILLRTRYHRGPRLCYEVRGEGTVNVPGEAGKAIRERSEQMMGMGMGMGGPGMGMPGMGMPGMGMPGMGMPGMGMPGMGMPGMGGPGMGMPGMGMPGMGMGGMGMGGPMPEMPLDNPSTVDFEIGGRWYEECLSPTETGRAVIDKDFVEGYYSVSWRWPKTGRMAGMEFKEEKNVPDAYAEVLPAAGEEYRFKVFPDGRVEKMHDDQDEFALGELFVELPDKPVRVKSTWTGDMAVLMGPNSTKPKMVKAIHRLDSFEYKGAYRCARILSRYEKQDTEIAWDFPSRTTAAVPGMGGMAGGPGGMPGMGAPGMGMPSMGAPGMGMPGMGAPGMGGPGMGGMGGMGMMSLADAPLKGDITVNRISYFAIDEGRFVAIEDEVELTIENIGHDMETQRLSGATETHHVKMDIYDMQAEELIASLTGGAVGMGGMGMGSMGMGGMGMGAMPPGMAGGGMGMPPGFGGYGGAMGPPGGAAGMPGMMPGMPGMGGPGGMMGMGMVMPKKATIEITANWRIYETTAGIHTHAVAWEAQ